MIGVESKSTIDIAYILGEVLKPSPSCSSPSRSGPRRGLREGRESLLLLFVLGRRGGYVQGLRLNNFRLKLRGAWGFDCLGLQGLGI